ITDLIFLDHTSPLFDPCRLKNAQEMLACEGVIATLFYRTSTDSILSNHYRSSVFYEQFLRDSFPAGISVESLFTPLENVLLKSAYVMYQFKDKLTERSSPFLEFINNWCTLFPEDKEELLSVFLSTTVGKTVTDSLGAVYEKMAYAGMVGRFNEYKRLRKIYEDGLARLTSDVLTQKVAFDANVGPQLWVENSALSIPVTLFAPEPKFPLNVNINTASVFDLASFPGNSMAQAQGIIRARDKQGWFKSLDEARQNGFKF
ncbi:MAG: helix-hairpin-helix domain-containing protein, partial [candidate division Zixibacteria bacterium]|nr:helix-hairpin-helix domain-containing protein [candidate division Zixibacteria bacterium]